MIQHSGKNALSDRYPRLVGVGLLAVGVLLAKWQIHDPLNAAELGRERVVIHAGLIGLGVMLPAAGILHLIFGGRMNDFFRRFAHDPNNLRVSDVLLLLGIAAPQLALVIYIVASLERQGYRVSHGIW